MLNNSVIERICQNALLWIRNKSSYQVICAPFFCVFMGFLVIWQWVVGIHAIYTLDNALPKTNLKLAFVKPMRSNDPSLGLSTPFFGAYLPHRILDASIQESALNLEVVGILCSDNPIDSYVILRIGAEQKAFREQSVLPGGAVIKRITLDQVVIERRGVLESIHLPKNELIFEPQPKALNE